MNDNEIYKIRERGQVVNEACQWIAEHRRLAMSLAVRPILILTAIELVNILFIKSIAMSLIIGLVALLLVPMVPSMMMFVAENAEEYDYPNRQPKLLELWDLWKSYFASALLIGVIGGVASFLCSVTMVGPIFIEMVQNVVLVVHQRNRDDGLLSAIARAFSLSFTNFLSLMLMILGTTIITASMMLGPLAMGWLIFMYLRSMFTFQMYEVINNVMDSEAWISLVLTVLAVGYIFANMTSIIIAHFFYGHCIACENQREAIRQERKKRREEANKA